MNPAVVYLIKINVAIALCYLAYMLFFRNDAFLRGKRLLLLSMMAFSLLYPFLTQFQSIFNSLFASGFSVSNYSEILLDEVVVMARLEGQTGAATLLQYLPTMIYLAGVAVMLIRIILQIISVIYQIHTAKPIFFGDTKIYEKTGLETPFSFFRYIVLDPTRYDSNELSEIMQHETTHCRQRHTIDLLASELICIFCWFNPFAWLLSRETRLNLEYLADRSVLEAGCNREHYQFHLLQLTYNNAITTITNNFNISQLKQRIIMINKSKKSNRIGVKYLLVLPLAALLLCLNCTEKNNKAENPAVTNTTTPEVIETHTPVKGDTVYQSVDEMAVFPGGEVALLKWVSENLVYPVKAMQNEIQGRVSVRFVIQADGTVDDVKLMRSVSPELDKEAIRVVKTLPKFQPAKMNGEAVAVYYNLPIRFRLTDN